MRTIITSMLLCLLVQAAAAQTQPEAEPIYDATQVDVQASFPSSKGTVFDFVFAHMKYPEAAKKDKASGMLFVEFVVEKDGTLSTITPKGKELHPAFKQMGTDIVKAMPRWTPAKKGGQPVRSRASIGPIRMQYTE